MRQAAPRSQQAAVRGSSTSGCLRRWSARGVRLEDSSMINPFRRQLLPFAAVCLAAAGTCWTPNGASAQSLPTPQMPQVMVVTGSHEPVSLDRLAADVVLIDRATIETTTADSVADLLRREAGVQISRNGGPGQSSGALLRGAASVNTVVLVDGVRIGSATLGFAQLDALSPTQVDHIEVLRGPGSSLFGADAVGGVVQIFTRRGSHGAHLDAQAAVGGYGSSDVSAALSGAAGPWDYAVSAGRERSRGVSALRPGDTFGNYNPDTDGYGLTTAQARIGLTPSPGHRIGLTLLASRLNAQYDGAEYLPPDFLQDPTPDFRNRLTTNVATLDWRGVLGPALTASARVAHSVDDLHSGGSVVERFRTVRDRMTAQIAWQAGAVGEVIGAVEHVQESARASSFSSDAGRRTNSIVVALEGTAGGWSWQADLRHDDSSDVGGVGTARLGGSLRLSPQWRLRALAGTTFRAPSFNDLYYPGYGVATLRPERGRSVEVGVNWREGPSEVAATLYRNRVRDLIGYESDPAACPADPSYSFGCARNLSRARLQGATLSGHHQAGALGLRAQLDLVDATDEATGHRLARRAAHQGSLSTDWTAGRWTFGASLLRIGSRPDGGAQLPAETTLDLSALWRLSTRWQLQAKLLNATDTDVQPALDYQGLGRQAWLMLRYQGGP